MQLLKETRVPIAATKHHARRVDYEYERAGTASVFMFAEPLQGWRHVRVRAQRTKVDWALEMEALLRTRDAEAQKVLVVCDNFNTHTMGAFYEAFAAERNGSWSGGSNFGTRPSTAVGSTSRKTHGVR